jgi:hypothetical protein
VKRSGLLQLKLSPKVPQPNGEVFRTTIPQGSEQSLLFRCLDPTFEVAPAQCLILGLARQKNGTVIQRKSDLLPGQQIRKQTDASLMVRQWNDELFLESAANGCVDSLKVIAGSHKKDMTVVGADAVHLLEQLADDLIRQLIIAALAARSGAMTSNSSRNRIAGALDRARSKSIFTRLPLWPR